MTDRINELRRRITEMLARCGTSGKRFVVLNKRGLGMALFFAAITVIFYLIIAAAIDDAASVGWVS